MVLGSVLSAIIHGVDIVDTNIWNFAGGPAAPAIELIYVFCKKLGIQMDVNMEAVAKINNELYFIRKELEAFDAVKQFPKPFNPLTDTLPASVDKEFDNAIAAAKNNDEEGLLRACHAIEAYFNFPAPNELVKKAEIPGGMYTNMVAQLKQFNSLDIIEDAMALIPSVRLDAGLPPLVTPTSQIIGSQAVNSALAAKANREKYSNVSNQFISLVKGEYGKTPVPVDPDFRLKIAGTREEIPYDTSNYQLQPNPVLTEFGDVLLAKDEKEQLLLELFPTVALNYLKGVREKEYNELNQQIAEQKKQEEVVKEPEVVITGKVIESPMPGTIWKVLVKEGDTVKRGDSVLILEAMKMENNIASEYNGTVKRIFVKEGSFVKAESVIMEIEE